MPPVPKTAWPEPETLLPLKSVDTLILTMLAAGERHGYGIRQDILTYSNGAIELEAGNLYRHMRRLESKGLIEAAAPRRESGDDERRIYHRLTPFGHRVLAAEMLRLRALVRLAVSRQIIAPGRA
ncbi:MAG TPA: helix-turn-helix transcriptional regulator [Gemmatimonadaceae bacterium]|nr:helix-turn-helix transcriptional regulator [Gemmatimonadaceae bacterium]